jgi:cytosine/uracil/thiamine/allantoin permease
MEDIMQWVWWKSKTVWTAIFAALAAWVFVLTGVDAGYGSVTAMQAIIVTVTALGTIFLREGVAKSGPSSGK